MDKKIAAKLMFDADWPQFRIAQVLGITERTLSAWAVKGKWKQERQRRDDVYNFLSEGFLDAAHYQMEVTTRLNSMRRRELDKPDLTIKELEALLMPGGEVDRLTKIANNIKKHNVAFGNLIEVVNQFTAFLSDHEPELAKNLVPFANHFIENQRKEA